MTDLGTKSHNKSDEKPIVIRNTTDLQRLKLEKLMKNPDKPVVIPERPKGRSMPTVPDFVRNVMGSSAGAGSGEFHVYRHLRRKEYARQKFIQEKSEKEKLNDEYHQRLENNQKLADEKTAKKRAKRLKRKMRAKQNAKKPKIEPKSESSDEQSSDQSENENTDSTKETTETIEVNNIKKESNSEESINENIPLQEKDKNETPQNDEKECKSVEKECQSDGKECQSDEKECQNNEKECQSDEKEGQKDEEECQNDENKTS